MKGIIRSHSALTASKRQSAVDAVSISEFPASREAAVSSTNLRAVRVSISEEEGAVAGGEAVIDGARVERLRRAMEAGNLKFDAQLVAQRLMEQEE